MVQMTSSIPFAPSPSISYNGDVEQYVKEVTSLDSQLGPHASREHLAWRGLVPLEQLIDLLNTDGRSPLLRGVLDGPLGRLSHLRGTYREFLEGAISPEEVARALTGFRQAYVEHWKSSGVDVEGFASAHGLAGKRP